MISIRWHGRGGQGAKTAAHLMAVAFLKGGRYPMAFPEYVPERTGAPIAAYTRADSHPVRLRSSIKVPDLVVVLDPSLLGEVPVAEGIPDDGWLIVNRPAGPPPAGFNGTLWNLPADQIARDAGARFANTVFIGALAGLIGEPNQSQLRDAVGEVMGRLAPEAFAASWRALEAGFGLGAERGIHRVIS